MHTEVRLKLLLLIAVAVVVNMLYEACYTHMHIHSHIYKLKYCTIQYYDIYLTERTNTFVCTPTSTIAASLATLYQTASD
jgi:L-rhamnose mutarotase